MSAGKSPRLWGCTPLSLPYLTVLALVASVPLALLLGSLPLSSRARLLLLERFLDSSLVAAQQRDADGPRPLLNGIATRRQRCAVYNGVNFHLDVTAGLAWAFQEAGCDTNVYMHPSAYGLQDLMKGWLRGELLPREQMEADQSQYDVLVLATFPEGPTYQDRQNRMLLSRPPHQRILLGVHNPGWLLYNAGQLAPPLLLAQAVPHNSSGRRARAPAPPVQLLSLAPMGSTYTRALLRSWLADMRGWDPQLAHVQPQLEVPWIAPLVPWAPPGAAGAGSSRGAGDSSGIGSGKGAGEQRNGPARELRHLCIQGTIHPRRRDYEAAFAAAAHPAVLAQLRARGERLLLVGSVKQPPPVPTALQPFVRTLSSLSYSEYYTTLSRCRAILTAFRSDQYLVNKTSSTVAAALQVGTPLLTEGRVLTAYRYVPRAAAFIYAPLNSTAQPDAAALAAAEGRRLSRWMQQQAESRAQLLQRKPGSRRRQMAELQYSVEEQWQQDDEQDGSPVGSTQQQHAQQPSRAGGAAAMLLPGSYASAILRAFDDAAAHAAHTAAWHAKRAVMQRNAEAARQVMSEAALLTAAVRASH